MPKFATDTEHSQQRGSMDVLYNSDEFRMYCFKVLPCSKHYSHDWTICPFAHPGEKARRRDPRVFKYAGVECPHVKELCNEPASCKRKVCFFAHALEELREPSNPIDSLPEGGIGSGTAPLMSLDGLATSGAFSGLLPQHRHSVDAASLQQQMGVAASSQLNLNDLVSNMQGLSLQNQTQQNQQLTQLLINLLAEIDLNGQRQNLAKTAQQFQCDPAFHGGVPSTLGALPRWSVDGHMLPTARFPSVPVNFQNPQPIVPGVLNDNLGMQQHEAMFNRSTSMESSIHDALAQGLSSHGRVSIDNAALTRAPFVPPITMQQQMEQHQPLPQLFPKSDARKLSFRSIVEDVPARSSDEDSSATSSGNISTDSTRTESYPMSYPLEVRDARTSVDCTLPESFILF